MIDDWMTHREILNLEHARRTKELERASDRAKVESRFVDNALNAMIRTGQKFDSERIKNELAICEER